MEGAWEVYGARFGVRTNDAGLEPVIAAALPPHVRPFPVSPVDSWYALDRCGSGYRVRTPDREVETDDRSLAAAMLENALALAVASGAEPWVLVHAGVVAIGGRAIVLPGSSGSGKSSLVHAFLEKGAGYYSDEFAVIDPDGLVWPYARPLALRHHPHERPVIRSAPLARARPPLPAALIAATAYAAGTTEVLSRGSQADGVMVLLSAAIGMRFAPARTMAALSRAAQGALILVGPRGEAPETAAALLAVAEADR